MISTMENGVQSICVHKPGKRVRERGIHHTEWAKAGQDRWKAFVEANPDLGLTRRRPKCYRALKVEHRACKYHERISGSGIDHWHGVKLGNWTIVVSQPYGWGPQDDKDLPDDVIALDAGTDRSWYFPGSSHLVLIGVPEAVQRVRLDYDVSWCAPVPDGCR